MNINRKLVGEGGQPIDVGHGVQLNPQFLVYGNGTLIRELEILRSTSPLRTEEEPNLTVDG